MCTCQECKRLRAERRSDNVLGVAMLIVVLELVIVTMIWRLG